MSAPHDFDVNFSRTTRFKEKDGSAPEQLIGAALAGCYSMSLAHVLASEGMQPSHIETTAVVSLDAEPGGMAITKIDLETSAEVPGADPSKFALLARAAKESCPVAKALIGTSVTVTAQLV
jgi:osmotically inducible protein OsmC